MTRRVAVVGAGFLGGSLVDALVASGTPSTLVKRSPSSWTAPRGHEWTESVRVVAGDACDPTVARAALADAEHVVWCAGGPMPAEAEAEPLRGLHDTLAPLQCFLDHLDGASVRRFTYISSGGTVYGGHHDGAISEETVPEPTTAYGIARLTAEHMLRRSCRQQGVELLVLRCGNISGPGQPAGRSQGLVATALSAAVAGDALPVFGDGLTERDYMHVDDFVRAVEELSAVNVPWEVVNVGSGHTSSVVEVLAAVEAATACSIDVERRPTRSCDVDRIALDVSRLRSLIPIEPVDLVGGVAATARALRHQHVATRT